ncbi:MAG: TIGR04283 family arsenosugar biosynthesis glycosyltransferase [Leeuwenhoekiella sp.]
MLSIIIPTLNEEFQINEVLNHLINASSGKFEIEIIIADGGSTDRTEEIVADFISTIFKPTIKFIRSEKGRANQMNAGSREAAGTVLYFLHADSFPPENFDELILDEVKNGNLAGCFKMRFDRDHWWLHLAGWFTKFNWRPCRGGDQSQFITRALFDKIGGYDENYAVYEDNILINALYERKQFTVIQEEIVTSARLYELHGVWYTQFHFLMIYIKKRLGTTPEKLAAYHRKKFKLRHKKTKAYTLGVEGK